MKNARKKSKLYKSLQKIKQAFPSIPNIRLRLTLKDQRLTQNQCEDLQKILKLEQELKDSKVEITGRFHRYKWDIKVRQQKQFKRALSTYQKNILKWIFHQMICQKKNHCINILCML